MKLTIDGNTAVSRIAYYFSEVACIYPITPSSPMAELVDEYATKNQLNLFGEKVNVVELQSEAGVSGAVHGSLTGGALTTTFTSSQGLLLMIPNMYKIAGELLPCVFHVSARALSTHALSIFGDHSDVMAVRSTGFSMLCSSSPQEAQDMALVSHLATLKSSVPFLHFFDGFRTSHEIQKIDGIDLKDIEKILPKKEIMAFKNRSLNSFSPRQQGTAQNPDIYFQNRERANEFYDKVPDCVLSSFDDLYKITGRRYKLYEYYGDKNAEDVIVSMGSSVQTIKETVDYLNSLGQKVGVVIVRLFRPFVSKMFAMELPKTVKRIAVLDRTKESGSGGEPLYKDVVTSLTENNINVEVLGGRYGLGGKEFLPCMVKAVFDNLKTGKKNHFTVGINDDITFTSLPYDKDFKVKNDNYTCKFYGLGSDGTVSANKNSIKIIGENTDLLAQGYFEYDSKKSGSATISHLKFGKSHINSPYLITDANFIACSNINFVGKYDMEKDLREGGVFLLNSPYDEKMLDKVLPKTFFDTLKERKAKLYIVDAQKVASESGLGNKTNVVMQACFFKLTNIIEYNKVENLLIEAASKTYAKKGQKIVEANVKAIKNATFDLKEVDLSKVCGFVKSEDKSLDPYDKNFIKVIEHKNGDSLPVSSFDARGYVKTDTAKFEKRGISIVSPCWIKENCLQCNLCSLVCPHASIRPKLISDEQLKNAPKSFETIKALGVPNYNFRMQIDVRDCTGCGNCERVCPAKNKALKMVSSVDLEKKERENYEYSKDIENIKTIFSPSTVKGSQFLKPYFEFSGACAGCGETPYIKLASQLFGKRMVIANATGCSSIYSGSAPTTPFAQNKEGRGVSWASSLFEDNAEFGFGIKLAQKMRRNRLKNKITDYVAKNSNELANLFKELLDNFEDGEKTYELSLKIAPLIKGTEWEDYEKDITKESLFIIGGDGWAYDIGFGGLDEVLASGENVNILVLDTEVYSNTGGQMSKSTPLSATAKFASAGKRTPKKDLGMIAMSYKNVYVAQVGLGADPNQAVKAMVEAESYDGPGLIIAYSPCINHGINMNFAQEEIKKAVECGYWHLYRYDPRRISENKNPFILDSKAPTRNYKEFLQGESRYTALLKTSPEEAEKLYEESAKWADERYKKYLELSQKE